MNLEQSFVGFTNTLTYTIDDFYNTIHRDQDHNSYVYGIWAPTIEQNGRLAKVRDGFYCNGRHFVVPSYKVFVNMGLYDGVVEIVWRGN